MNKYITSILVTTVITCGGLVNANPARVGAKEYLTLNKENLPPMQVVIQAALDASDIETVPLHTMKKRARNSAWLPRVRLRMDYDADAYDNWAFTEDARVYASTGTTKQDRWERDGSDDRLSYGAYAEWDLSVLVWEKQDHQLAEKYSKQGGLKRRRIVEVSKRYAALLALLPADESGSVAGSDIANVLDNAIYLDAITDYMLSDALLRMKATEESAVSGQQAPSEAVEPPDQAVPVAEEKSLAPAEQGTNVSDEDKSEMLDFLNAL